MFNIHIALQHYINFSNCHKLLRAKKKKKVEVTLLTLMDAWLTSSYETLQTHAFATSPPNAQKQLWWRAASGVVFLFQSQLACLHRSRWHCALGPPSWPHWCEFSVWVRRYLGNSLMSLRVCQLLCSQWKTWMDQPVLWRGSGGTWMKLLDNRKSVLYSSVLDLIDWFDW